MLRDKKDTLIERWCKRVNQDPRLHTAHWMTRQDLIDRMPSQIDLLIDALEQPEPQAVRPEKTGELPAAPALQKHAQSRFDQGYSLRECMLELSLLRTAIFELIHEQEDQVTAHVVTRVNGVIDDLMVADAIEFGSKLALHRLEERHRLERELLRSILEQAGDAIVMADARGVLRFMNREAEEQIGVPFQELSPERWAETYPMRKPDGSPFKLEERPLYRALQGEQVADEEIHVVRPDGSVRILAASATPLKHRDGSNAGAVLVSRDETTSRRRIKELEISEERFRTLLEGVRDYAILMVDPQGKVLSWNTGAERLTGYSAAEMIGQSVARLRSPEDVQTGVVEQTLKQAASSDWLEAEVEYLRKDKSRFWGYSVLRPVRDASGQIRGYSKVIRDITDRRRAEEALRRSEARFRRLVESNIIGTLVGDQAGTIREANDAFLSMVGRSRGELTRGCLDWVEMTAPEYLPLHEKALEEINARGACTPYEVEFIRTDGSRVPVLIGAASLGGTQGEFTCFALDLTEGRQIEAERTRLLAREQVARAEAEKAQQRLAFLAEASVQLSASLDYRTTFQTLAHLAVPHLADWCVIRTLGADDRLELAAVAHADPEMEVRTLEFLQRSPETSMGVNVVEMALQTGLPQLYPYIDQSNMDRIEFSPEELEQFRRLGPLSLIAVPLSARGRTLGIISFLAGGAGRRYGPDDLAMAVDLASRAAMAVDNARLYEEAQNAVLAREEFLAIASHELRTPLAAMDLEVQLFRRRYNLDPSLLTPQVMVRTIDNVGRQCKRLFGLIDNLLDISSLASGQLKLELSEVDLSQVVHDVLRRFSEALEESGCTVRLQLQPGVIGHWDWTRLEQVVTNLLSNAMKYGRGKLIEVSLEVENDMARLKVQDHGDGIPASEHARIFERYVRVSKDHRKSSLGLGLYIAMQIVKAHGGTIRVQSEPEKGALFTVELPLAGPPLPP